jgi:hypothetical protein
MNSPPVSSGFVLLGGIQHILYCVFVLFFFVLCTLCCQFLRIAPSVFFSVYVVLSVLLRFKDYDYSFGIFKLFLSQICAIFCVLHELIITHFTFMQ